MKDLRNEVLWILIQRCKAIGYHDAPYFRCRKCHTTKAERNKVHKARYMETGSLIIESGIQG